MRPMQSSAKHFARLIATTDATGTLGALSEGRRAAATWRRIELGSFGWRWFRPLVLGKDSRATR
jgi:hypothetical protein